MLKVAVATVSGTKLVVEFGMITSRSVEAARRFLSIVWEADVPSDVALLSALDNLIAAFHETPDVGPSESDLEAPRAEGPVLYKETSDRFPDYSLYPVSDPISPRDDASMMGDPIDDLADITRDMREVVWLADNVGLEDAHWSFRLLYFHWGRHARELALYLHARQFG